MNNQRSLGTGLLFAAALAVPMSVSAAPMDVPSNVTVQFGQNQFPQDAPPFNRFMDPNEVTIVKGGTVTFEFNGAGHGIAIYRVSPTTDRPDIEEDLCQPDPVTCDAQGAATSDLQYFVTDRVGDVIVDTGINPPNTRVNDPIDRLVYGGGPVAFTGRTVAGAPAPLVEYKFEKVGRYLVICTSRNHFINDRMFGFVNVVRKRQKDASESE